MENDRVITLLDKEYDCLCYNYYDQDLDYYISSNKSYLRFIENIENNITIWLMVENVEIDICKESYEDIIKRDYKLVYQKDYWDVFDKYEGNYKIEEEKENDS